jgi:hypothetical protein
MFNYPPRVQAPDTRSNDTKLRSRLCPVELGNHQNRWLAKKDFAGTDPGPNAVAVSASSGRIVQRAARHPCCQSVEDTNAALLRIRRIDTPRRSLP